MSARSIAVTDLTWRTPEGRAVFDKLNLTFGRQRTGIVGRNGVGKSTLLALIAGDRAPHGGAVSVHGRLAVLRQQVQVASDQTVADLFGVAPALDVLARAAAGAATVEDLSVADWTLEERVSAALAKLGVTSEPAARLATLSGGQRTRAALAALVFAEPDFLLLDEPTNNLDRDGREAVETLLASWRSGALVVSHDRGLLDAMDAIVELNAQGAARYGGGWSAYHERKTAELEAVEHDLALAERRLAGTARQAQAIAERRDRKDSAGRRTAARGDMPKILLGARKSRAEESTGEAARIGARQLGQAQEQVEAARARVEVLAPLAVGMPSTKLAQGRSVLRLEALSIGYRPEAPLASGLDLALSGPVRLAITGPNGSGKSTLLATIIGKQPPLAGAVSLGVAWAFLDQEVSVLRLDETILENFQRLHPASDENVCRSSLARFGFRADAALQRAGGLSGGQLLRAGLACVLGAPEPPQLLILDEPTNHLDTDSIEAVEVGLRTYDGALVVVSHDDVFLEAIAADRRLDLCGHIAV